MWSKKGQQCAVTFSSFCFCCCFGCHCSRCVSHIPFTFNQHENSSHTATEWNWKGIKNKIDSHRRALRFQLFKNNRIGADFSREWKRRNEIHRKCVRMVVCRRGTEFCAWHSGNQLINEACSRTWMALSKRKIRKLVVGSASNTRTKPALRRECFNSPMSECECGLCSVFVFDSKMSYLFISRCLRSDYLCLSSLYSRMQSKRVRKRNTPPTDNTIMAITYTKRITPSNINATAMNAPNFLRFFSQVHVNRTFIAVMNR